MAKGVEEHIDSSSIVVYRKASLNLHRHILQRVRALKERDGLPVDNERAFAFHSKLHSPMIPIRIEPISAILTFDTVYL